jgi:hypothetical protein
MPHDDALDLLCQKLRWLRLPGMVQLLPSLLEQARQDNLITLDVIDRLCDEDDRSAPERSARPRPRQCRFPCWCPRRPARQVKFRERSRHSAEANGTPERPGAIHSGGIQLAALSAIRAAASTRIRYPPRDSCGAQLGSCSRRRWSHGCAAQHPTIGRSAGRRATTERMAGQRAGRGDLVGVRAAVAIDD